MRDVSVLTIARGREAHLHNVIRGLAAQTVPPRELVIAAMQDELYDGLPDVPFPIHHPSMRAPLLTRATLFSFDTLLGRAGAYTLRAARRR